VVFVLQPSLGFPAMAVRSAVGLSGVNIVAAKIWLVSAIIFLTHQGQVLVSVPRRLQLCAVIGLLQGDCV
jgi:hypothetical protein